MSENEPEPQIPKITPKKILFAGIAIIVITIIIMSIGTLTEIDKLKTKQLIYEELLCQKNTGMLSNNNYALIHCRDYSNRTFLINRLGEKISP
jgi:hypothetical protein